MERGGKSTEATRAAQAQGHVDIRPERSIGRAQEHHPPHRAGQACVHLYHTKIGESARGGARRSGRTRARRELRACRDLPRSTRTEKTAGSSPRARRSPAQSPKAEHTKKRAR